MRHDLKIFFMLWLFSLSGAMAQPLSDRNFVRYGTREGLSNERVSGLVQDSFGFIWISTRKGLNRFDGSSFLQFLSDTSKNSLPQDQIIRLKQLPRNELAAVTPSGLFLINTRTLKSRTVILPPDSLRFHMKVNSIIDFSGDDNGNIFLLTRSGFYAVDKNGKLWFRYDHYSQKEAAGNVPFYFGSTIMDVGSGKYAMATQKGLLLFDSYKKKLLPIDDFKETFFRRITGNGISPRALFNEQGVFMIIRDSTRHIEYFNATQQTCIPIPIPWYKPPKFDWRSAMFKLDDKTFAISGSEFGFYFVTVDAENNRFAFDSIVQFGNLRCRALLKDRSGRLWIGTSNGLFRQKNVSGRVEKIKLAEVQNPTSADVNFRDVVVVKDKIIAGSLNGLYVFNREDGRFLKHIDLSKVHHSANYVLHCLVAHGDSVLVNVNGPLVKVHSGSLAYTVVKLPQFDLKYDWIPATYKDNKGRVFLASNDYGKFYSRKNGENFFRIEDHTGDSLFRTESVSSIVGDGNDHLWFSGRGVSRYNIMTGHFDLRIDSLPFLKVQRQEVYAIQVDKTGTVYMAVAENGLVSYNPENKKFSLYTRQNGLPENNISALFMLGEVLWIGTESGIASFDTRTKKIDTYGANESMPDEVYTGVSFFYDSLHAQLYTTFNNSILRFNPHELKKSSNLPVFFIESIRIDSRREIFHPTGDIVLPYDENNLYVSTASINFDDPWQQQFYYRMVHGKDTSAWQFSGNQRNFILPDLSTGNHIIQFMVESRSNSWEPQIISTSIRIKPPFWNTVLFKIITALVIAMAGFIILRSRVSRLRQKALLDRKLTELEFKALHAQMNPHFIFNALNSIKEMIWQDDKSNASRYLSKFAQLIRTNLEQSRQAFITIRQCVQHLEQYLEMEKIRFEDFTYDISVDSKLDTEEVNIAPMLVQPLVENAIWHGLRNATGERQLNIRFYRDKNYVICEVSDTGPGMINGANPKAITGKHKSIGITNIYERLKVLNEKYRMDCSLTFIDKSSMDKTSQGTIAILKLTI